MSVIGMSKRMPIHRYAQPDVVIGMSVLSYHYEGLRLSDLRAALRQLKADMNAEAGPSEQRPSCLLFKAWLSHAAGMESLMLPLLQV